jgi:hypothetical protein
MLISLRLSHTGRLPDWWGLKRQAIQAPTFIKHRESVVSMKEIITVISRPEGLDLLWEQGTESRTEPFTFEELVDMKINAGDLLEHPQDYALDVNNHKIVMKKLSFLKK